MGLASLVTGIITFLLITSAVLSLWPAGATICTGCSILLAYWIGYFTRPFVHAHLADLRATAKDQVAKFRWERDFNKKISGRS